MNIEDYKKLFELKHEGGWSDDNVWYARCKICGILPIFDKYTIRNWYNLNGYQREKRFYSAIRHHVNIYHHELIPSKRTTLLEQYAISGEALKFLQNFPFRPIKEEKLNGVHKEPVRKESMKFWKPGIIVMPHQKGR